VVKGSGDAAAGVSGSERSIFWQQLAVIPEPAAVAGSATVEVC